MPESIRASDTPDDIVLPALSVGLTIHFAIAGAALLLRLFGLGAAPLNSEEARQAIAAYQFSQGGEFVFAGSPILFFINSVFFALFAASDFTSRLGPALAGTALVLLPLLFRRDVGRTGALIASVLLAFSPSLTYFSRTLDSAIPAAAAALALVACGLRYFESHSRRDLFTVIFFAALALLALPDLSAGGSLLNVLRLLVIYDPLVTLFGIVAIGELMLVERRMNRRPLFAFAIWSAVALAFIAPSAQSSSIAFVVVPLAILAGFSIGAWVERMIVRVRELGTPELLWHEAPILGLSIGLVAFLSIVTAEFAQRGNIVTADSIARLLGSAQDNPALGNVMVALLFFFAFVAAAVLAVTTLGTRRARNVGILFALALLSAWTFRQSMMLNFTDSGGYNPQEWIVARAASPNVRDLANDLGSQSRWRANDTYSIVVRVDRSLGPMVQWNLRKFRSAQFSSATTLVPGAQAVVSSVGAPTPAGTWIAQRYQLELSRGVDPVSSMRALIYRDVGRLESTDAILWVPRP